LLTLGSKIIIKLIDETVEYFVWNGFILFQLNQKQYLIKKKYDFEVTIYGNLQTRNFKLSLHNSLNFYTILHIKRASRTKCALPWHVERPMFEMNSRS
jgi:hypothetical protein